MDFRHLDTRRWSQPCEHFIHIRSASFYRRQ